MSFSGHKLNVRAPEDMIERLDDAAGDIGVSRSQLARRIITEFLAKHENQEGRSDG